MSTGIVEIMKRAAMDAIESRQMCDLRFGTVVSTSPLKVQITNQFTIPESLLIVPKHLTDYTVKVSFDWNTEKAGSHSHGASVYGGAPTTSSVEHHYHDINLDIYDSPEHSHNIKSTKNRSITIHNALVIGDKVALLRKTGGQSYYILDRI